MKRAIVLTFMMLVSTALFGGDKPADTGTKPLYLTVGELSLFNGKNGNPSYIAVDGIVYDVTGVKAWKSGGHKNGKAGTDISKLLKKAPHGKKILAERTVVGKIVKAMTLTEIAKYDGQNGNAPYVVVNGLVYDQSGIEPWKSGEHKGGKAGTDITDKIKNAPHGLSVFNKREPIAKIVPEKK